MTDIKVARRYAKSLLGLAEERGIRERVFADMQVIENTIKANRELAVLLKAPTVNPDKKEAIISQIFAKHTDPLTLSFLLIINRKSRSAFLSGIATEYIKLYKSMNGIVTAYITSATKLDDATRNKILEVIGHKNKTIELVEKVNPDIIGGFILRVGDEQVDASISKKLNQLRQEFDENLYVGIF